MGDDQEIEFELEDVYTDVEIVSESIHEALGEVWHVVKMPLSMFQPPTEDSKLEMCIIAKEAFNNAIIQAIGEGSYVGTDTIQVHDLPKFKASMMSNVEGVQRSIIAVKLKFSDHILPVHRKKILGVRRFPIAGAAMPTFVEFVDPDVRGKNVYFVAGAYWTEAAHIMEAVTAMWRRRKSAAMPAIDYIIRLPESNVSQMSQFGILGNRRRILHLMVVIPHVDSLDILGQNELPGSLTFSA
eukprot:7060745-Pyramimonas_sp.AAC.1